MTRTKFIQRTKDRCAIFVLFAFIAALLIGLAWFCIEIIELWEL